MQGAKHRLKPVKVEFKMDLVVIYNMVRSLLVLGHWCVIPIKTLMEHFLGIGHVNYLSSLTKNLLLCPILFRIYILPWKFVAMISVLVAKLFSNFSWFYFNSRWNHGVRLWESHDSSSFGEIIFKLLLALLQFQVKLWYTTLGDFFELSLKTSKKWFL